MLVFQKVKYAFFIQSIVLFLDIDLREMIVLYLCELKLYVSIFISFFNICLIIEIFLNFLICKWLKCGILCLENFQ